jgi:LPS O-antigen subunit length determinant protein (WzzB/FepE family)
MDLAGLVERLARLIPGRVTFRELAHEVIARLTLMEHDMTELTAAIGRLADVIATQRGQMQSQIDQLQRALDAEREQNVEEAAELEAAQRATNDAMASIRAGAEQLDAIADSLRASPDSSGSEYRDDTAQDAGTDENDSWGTEG